MGNAFSISRNWKYYKAYYIKNGGQMAIFPRRVVQKNLDQIKGLFSENQLKKCLKELNSPDLVRSIAREWEVIVMHAFNTISIVEYEKDFGGKKYPDMFCRFPDGTCFLADITTISDRGLHEKNPVEIFCNEIKSFLRNKNISHKGIDIKIYGDIGHLPERYPMNLSLPEKASISEFIEQNLSSFISHILSQENEPCSVEIRNARSRIKISYSPENRPLTRSYSDYRVIYSPTSNPIYYRLKEKANQIKESGFLGTTGIILCDGGCLSLNRKTFGFEEISQDIIIQNFFEKYDWINFIIIITPEENPINLYGKHKKMTIGLSTYLNQNHQFTPKKEFEEKIRQIKRRLPIPESMPSNAIRILEDNRSKGLSHGAYSMEGNTIKLSARMLAELLSGELDFHRFNADYFGNRVEDAYPPNFFANRLAEGKMIESIRLEKSEESDDDWIIITFGNPDSAISPYK